MLMHGGGTAILVWIASSTGGSDVAKSDGKYA